MGIGRAFKGLLVSVAAIGFCLPESLVAAAESRGPVATDVALREGGILVGQVLNSEGTGLAGIQVSVLRGGKDSVTTTTGADGRFVVKGLPGGVYQIAAAEGHGVYRLWAANTAPPAATEEAVLVAGTPVVRGQGGNAGGMKMLLANPIVIAGVVATAVAVPVAVHNSQHHPVSP